MQDAPFLPPSLREEHGGDDRPFGAADGRAVRDEEGILDARGGPHDDTTSADASLGSQFPVPDSKVLSIWLRAVYARYNPTKLSRVDALLHKYKGREGELIEHTVAKYRLGPCAPKSIDWKEALAQMCSGQMCGGARLQQDERCCKQQDEKCCSDGSTGITCTPGSNNPVCEEFSEHS
mmetsp:Transcript_9743/g.28808  ORF Transcript_9743/g.28808 Transcript_9743/m.28808 type:complete len:178 (-) Transcript_9743:233-766(-)